MRRLTASSRIALLVIGIMVSVGCASGNVEDPSMADVGSPELAVSDAPPASTLTPTTAPPPTAAQPSPSPSVVLITPSPTGPLATTEPATTAPPGAITVAMAGPPPRYRPSKITAPAGTIVFYLVNESSSRDEHGTHSVAIGPDQASVVVASDEIPGGGRAVFTVSGLEPGVYAIWCTFPSHASLGQVGTLTIE